MRKEQDIFDELATLCTSPGYVHTIAYLCFRDNIIPYGDEMTAKDMQRLFSPERLLRTEISTLIGLLIKKEIDYALPTPDVTQQYITRTEELLEELHRAMSNEIFGGRDLKEVVESGLNPFDLGTALREPIFYGGESAYSFQYRDLSPKKYAADDEWLKSNKGFSVEAARDVVNALDLLRRRLDETGRITTLQSHLTRPTEGLQSTAIMNRFFLQGRDWKATAGYESTPAKPPRGTEFVFSQTTPQ